MQENLTQKLRTSVQEYNRCLRTRRTLEANTHLIDIKNLCDQLGTDWEVLVGIKDGFLFKESIPERIRIEQFKPENCLYCGDPIPEGSKSKFCCKSHGTMYQRKIKKI